MGHQQQRGAGRGQAPQGGQQLVAGAQVEAVGGFIQHQQLRLMHEGAGQQQPALLAIRELGERPLCQRRQPQFLHQFNHPLPLGRGGGLAAADTHRAEEAREHHIGGRNSRAVAVLEVRGDEADAAAQLPQIHRFAAEDPQVRARSHHRVELAAEQLHQGALAGPVRPQHQGVLAAVKLQAELLEHQPRPQPDVDRLQFEVGLAVAHGAILAGVDVLQPTAPCVRRIRGCRASQPSLVGSLNPSCTVPTPRPFPSCSVPIRRSMRLVPPGQAGMRC